MLRANFQVGASARVYACKTHGQVSQGKVNSIKKKTVFKIELQRAESFIMDPEGYSWYTRRYTQLFPVLDDKTKLLKRRNICEEWRKLELSETWAFPGAAILPSSVSFWLGALKFTVTKDQPWWKVKPCQLWSCGGSWAANHSPSECLAWGKGDSQDQTIKRTFPSDNSLSSPVLFLTRKWGGWEDTLPPLPPMKLNETWISQTKETAWRREEEEAGQL